MPEYGSDEKGSYQIDDNGVKTYVLPPSTAPPRSDTDPPLGGVAPPVTPPGTTPPIVGTPPPQIDTFQPFTGTGNQATTSATEGEGEGTSAGGFARGPNAPTYEGVGGGTGLGEGDDDLAAKRGFQKLAGFVVDPEILQSILSNFESLQLAVTDARIDPDTGDLVVIDDAGGIHRYSKDVISGSNPIDEANLTINQRRLELDEARNLADKTYQEGRLKIEQDMLALDEEIRRAQLVIEQQIADQNYEVAITSLDRKDELERQSRQLQRDLHDNEIAFKDRQLDLERDKFKLDELQFYTQLGQSPGSFADFFNISRGLAPVGAGGPLPQGIQRVVGGGPLELANQGQNAAGAASATQTGTQALGGQAGGQEGGQQGAPLPPAIAAILNGQMPNEALGPTRLPQGTVPALSPQVLAQLGPSEREAYQAIVKMQGVPLQDFEAFQSLFEAPQTQQVSRVG